MRKEVQLPKVASEKEESCLLRCRIPNSNDDENDDHDNAGDNSDAGLVIIVMTMVYHDSD